MKNSTIIVITLSIVFVVSIGMFFLQKSETVAEYSQDELTNFAMCLNESGAIFYGAFWCNHCQNQKSAFKEAGDLLPYVECSTPDGRGQIAECAEANITSYPTWDFSDGTRFTGEVPFSELALNSGCPAPVL